MHAPEPLLWSRLALAGPLNVSESSHPALSLSIGTLAPPPLVRRMPKQLIVRCQATFLTSSVTFGPTFTLQLILSSKQLSTTLNFNHPAKPPILFALHILSHHCHSEDTVLCKNLVQGI